MRVVPVGPAALDEAAAVLMADGMVVVPTDTVYGVAVRGGREAAVDILAAAKDRPSDQPVALLVGSAEQAAEVAELDDRARAVADAFWPGPVTLVVPRRPELDWDLGHPHDTVGLRRPEAPFLTELAQRVGPLAVTSANRHGDPTAKTAAAAAATLLGRVDLVVDGGSCTGEPSTIVDLTGLAPSFVRKGAIGAEQIGLVIDEA